MIFAVSKPETGTMHLTELKRAIKVKTIELELSLELKKPHEELLEIYKELKELKFQMLQKEISLENAEKSK